MSCPSPTGSGESVLTMATSALVRAVTRFDVDAESFEVIVCAVVVEIVEVMFSVVPAAVVVLAWTCGENVALALSVSGMLTEAPEASVAAVQLIVPVPPMAGVMQVQPAGGVMPWNVVFGGVVKVYVGLFAVKLPRFEIVCV